MTLLHNFAPEAIRDVEDAAERLADDSGDDSLARRFATAVAETAALLAKRPLIGHRRLELLPDPYRFHPVRGFSYLIVYNTRRPGAPVARVLYMGRDLPPLLAGLSALPES